MAKWKVGITGGIGSGKTYCARIFSRLGIPVYFADERARHLMISDERVREQLINLLGAETYVREGKLNKEFMRKQVFESDDMRQAINSIVHPAVGMDFEKWHMSQDSPYTLKEAALLVESGSYKSLDYLIMVRSPVVTRMMRVMNRDQIDRSAVINRMKSQLPDEEKEKVSNLFIDNSGCIAVLPQIIDIHKKLTN